ncbi:MAG: hypothetical protein KAJ58_00260 [Candidatus Pacebacteria bacterium]|nr:hypothetical protein [Candidatus Paceibacterota bacterium]
MKKMIKVVGIIFVGLIVIFIGALAAIDVLVPDSVPPKVSKVSVVQKSRVIARRERRRCKSLKRQAEYFRVSARVCELARQMGIEFDPQNAKLKLIAGVPIVINGYKVPENLFTKKEKEGIAAAETMRRTMMGKKENKGTNSFILESSPVDTSVY